MSGCCGHGGDGIALAMRREETRRVLLIVLAINAAMFFVEFGAGVIAQSASLMADSMDMLGDALVYIVSLYALDRSARAPRPPTTLGWRRIEFYKVPFGATRARIVSDADSLRLDAPIAVDVLGGQLRLEKFVAQPASPRGDRLAFVRDPFGLTLQLAQRAEPIV